MGYRYKFVGSISFYGRLEILQSFKDRLSKTDCLYLNDNDEIVGVDGSRDGWEAEEILRYLIEQAIELNLDPMGSILMQGDEEEDTTLFYVQEDCFRVVKKEGVKLFLGLRRQIRQKQQAKWERLKRKDEAYFEQAKTTGGEL